MARKKKKKVDFIKEIKSLNPELSEGALWRYTIKQLRALLRRVRKDVK